MKEFKKIYFDAREMEHPEPLDKSIHIIKSLDDHSYMYMLHRKKPLPLIDLAKEHRLNVLTREDENKLLHILICKNNTIDLNDFVDISPQ
jgi:hypothetical protein